MRAEADGGLKRRQQMVRVASRPRRNSARSATFFSMRLEWRCALGFVAGGTPRAPFAGAGLIRSDQCNAFPVAGGLLIFSALPTKKAPPAEPAGLGAMSRFAKYRVD